MLYFEKEKSFAHKLDQKDSLAGFRDRFYIPGNSIYMDGNSLGLLSKDAEYSVNRIMNEWRDLAIKGWLQAKTPWFYLAEEIGKKAANIVGAKPEELIMTGSTTVNIHALLSSFYKPEGHRTKI